MLRTYRAVIDEHGNVRLLEDFRPSRTMQALVTIIEEPIGDQQPAADQSRDRDWRHRYRPIRRLGRGGMGETFLAIDERLGHRVCVKSLFPRFDADMLQHECRAMVKLKHPYIVGLLDFDAASSSPYLVVDFVDGPTLASYLEEMGAVPEALVADLGRRLFEALAYAHGESVLHCDLKLANILVEHDGARLIPRIIDFGIAIVSERDVQGNITGEGMLVGTPNYMAPEQARGERRSGATDVYALGQILWECLTGRPAFEGSLHQVIALKAHQSSGLVLDDAHWVVSDEMRDCVRACTMPDPASRPSPKDAAAWLASIEPRLDSPAVALPTNGAFTWPSADHVPIGWSNGVGFVDGASDSYESVVVPAVNAEGRGCVRLFSRTPAPGAFGVLMQRFPARAYAGGEISIEIDVATEGVEDWAGLWLRFDDERASLYFDNMRDRPLRGTQHWTSCRLSAKVPPNATWINYGALLVGPGALLLSDVRFRARRKGEAWLPLTMWSGRWTAAADVPLT